jgi:hypothetical protein
LKNLFGRFAFGYGRLNGHEKKFKPSAKEPLFKDGFRKKHK